MALAQLSKTSNSGETAAFHMVTRIPRARPNATAHSVLMSLEGQKLECADTVFVTDPAGRLKGIVRINDLLEDGDSCGAQDQQDHNDQEENSPVEFVVE